MFGKGNTMSKKRKIKKIELETLEDTEKKAWKRKSKTIVSIFIILISISAISWGGYKIFENETLESKFVINNMTCGGCIGKVKRACTIPGVIETEVNLFTQTAVIKFKEKQTNPETIKAAIQKAGFPSILEGTVNNENKGVDEPVLASVNGQPIFRKDMEISLWSENGKTRQEKTEVFFDLIAGHVFLEAAVTERLFTHPFHVLQEAEKLRKQQKLTRDQFQENRASEYGSFEKYLQIAGCRTSALKVADRILMNIKDTNEKKAVLSKWLAERFQSLDVKIHDDNLKESLLASTGETSWGKIWPQIISRKTEIQNALIQ